MRTRLTALLLLLALTLPAAALAQSAGDDQYVDPFQGEQGGSRNENADKGSDDGGGMPLGVALGGTAVLAAGLVAGGIVLPAAFLLSPRRALARGIAEPVA